MSTLTQSLITGEISKELVLYSPDPPGARQSVLLNSHLKVNVLQSQWFGAHILDSSICQVNCGRFLMWNYEVRHCI